jgi:hypothetical protein
VDVTVIPRAIKRFCVDLAHGFFVNDYQVCAPAFNHVNEYPMLILFDLGERHFE